MVVVKKVAVVTLFPDMFKALTEYGVTGRAIRKGLLEISFNNPRDFTKDRYQTIDDRPYGGGPGMVMKAEPLAAAINAARDQLGQEAKVVYLSPQGKRIEQQSISQFATAADYCNMILLAGRYEGIDERLLQAQVDEEWSIGDYVLSGGELPAMVLLQ